MTGQRRGPGCALLVAASSEGPGIASGAQHAEVLLEQAFGAREAAWWVAVLATR